MMLGFRRRFAKDEIASLRNDRARVGRSDLCEFVGWVERDFAYNVFISKQKRNPTMVMMLGFRRRFAKDEIASLRNDRARVGRSDLCEFVGWVERDFAYNAFISKQKRNPTIDQDVGFRGRNIDS